MNAASISAVTFSKDVMACAISIMFTVLAKSGRIHLNFCMEPQELAQRLIETGFYLHRKEEVGFNNTLEGQNLFSCSFNWHYSMLYFLSWKLANFSLETKT